MENYLDSKSERMNRINVSESRFICSISLQITNKTVNVICEMKGFVYISVLGYYNVIVVLYLYLIPSRFIVIISRVPHTISDYMFVLCLRLEKNEIITKL